MKQINNSIRWCLLLACMLTGGILSAQTHKIQKDGKVKNKSHKQADHHQKTENKKKHHKTDFNHHSMDENKSFSKKKRKQKQ